MKGNIVKNQKFCFFCSDLSDYINSWMILKMSFVLSKQLLNQPGPIKTTNHLSLTSNHR